MFFKKPLHSLDWLRGRWVFVADGFFGDNGKGKITNFLCAYLREMGLDVGLCVRPNGGANAGHEVSNPFGRGNREGSYVGHITPMGLLQDVPALIGPGAVLDLEHFFETELPRLAAKGVDIEKVYVSSKTQIVLPHYKLLEEADEKARGASAVGTTKKAIGTTYEMRAKRVGIRVGDVTSNDFRALAEKVRLNVTLSAQTLPDNERFGLVTGILSHLGSYYDRLIKMAADEQGLYRQIRKQGLVGVAEMGQGTGLDNIHGDYPFVTSSLTTIPGGLAQAGLSHKDLGYGILVVKGPYWTRVGNGLFPTEFSPEEAEKFRQSGHEFGTTTGRPRRCGYPDIQVLAKAVELNGTDCICLTKMDATPAVPILKVKNYLGYESRIKNWLPAEVFGKTQFNELPDSARVLVHLYHQATAWPMVSLISTGPSLEDIIVTDDFLKKP